MSKEHLQADNAIIILLDMQKQTHSCVKELGKDVKRNTAFTVANGVKLDGVVEFEKVCDNRLKDVELWRAKHTGEAMGKTHKASRFNAKTTLVCVVAGVLLTLAGLWFTIVQPVLSINQEVLADFKAINGQLLELNILK